MDSEASSAGLVGVVDEVPCVVLALMIAANLPADTQFLPSPLDRNDRAVAVAVDCDGSSVASETDR